MNANYVIFTSVCRGLHPERQHAGDIVLGNHALHVAEKARPEGATGTAPLIIKRDLGWTTLALISRFRLHSPPTTTEGTMLCHGDVTESWTLADDLAALDPHAVSSTSDSIVPYIDGTRLVADEVAGWLVVNAVAWYGRQRSDAHDNLAADNAAAYVIDIAARGALDRIHR